MIMYSGMMPICTGIIMVARMTSRSPLRPRNLSLANAKPASDEKNTTETVITAELSSEFHRPSRKLASSAANSLPTLSPKLGPGASGGGQSPTTSLARVATTKSQ